jgi:hypothetical protein
VYCGAMLTFGRSELSTIIQALRVRPATES